jgi:hypothetical protein
VASALLVGCNSTDSALPATIDTTELIQTLQDENDTLREDIQQLQEEMESLSADSTNTVDTENLLLSICRSDDNLTFFPAHITRADETENGYSLSFDRLEFNPDFTPGGDSENGYLLNNNEEIEQIDTDFVYIQYIGGTITAVDDDFANYIASDGGDFTFFLLGDEVIYISEILVP